MNDMPTWTPPPVTDTELAFNGRSPLARKHPLSERAARWMAFLSHHPFTRLPAAWCYAPDPVTLALVEDAAIPDGPGRNVCALIAAGDGRIPLHHGPVLTPEWEAGYRAGRADAARDVAG
jgi:hypothetical protein